MLVCMVRRCTMSRGEKKCASGCAASSQAKLCLVFASHVIETSAENETQFSCTGDRTTKAMTQGVPHYLNIPAKAYWTCREGGFCFYQHWRREPSSRRCCLIDCRRRPRTLRPCCLAAPCKKLSFENNKWGGSSGVVRFGPARPVPL